MSKAKPTKRAHTASSQIGMGDSYGTGVKNKVGKVRQNLIKDTAPSVSNKQPGKAVMRKSIRAMA